MIYNYLIADYAQQENTRYSVSTHKKSELKKIYSDIVKISKESPAYLIQPSDETQEFAIQLKEDSLTLQDTLLKLQSGGLASAFSYKEVLSDNETALTTTIDTEDHSKLPDPFSIQINKLATKQRNAGSYVYKDTAKLSPGNYKFQIDVEEDSYLFQLQLHGKTKNQDAIANIVQAVNRSPVPITAFTQSDNSGDKMRLVLQSDDTGSLDGNPIFTCTDISHPSDSPGCVEYYHMDQLVQKPENSSFQINGQEKSTIANEFTLNNSLHLIMHHTTTEPIQINFTSNSGKIMNEVDSVANTYNHLVYLSHNQGNPPHLAARMLHDLKSLFSSSYEDLASCGVTFDEEGYMQIDEPVANQAAKSGNFQALFGNQDTLGTHIVQKAKVFSLDPMKYIENKVIVTYPNPKRENFANPYMTSIYSGMLFNSYC